MASGKVGAKLKQVSRTASIPSPTRKTTFGLVRSDNMPATNGPRTNPSAPIPNISPAADSRMPNVFIMAGSSAPASTSTMPCWVMVAQVSATHSFLVVLVKDSLFAVV